MTTDEPISGSPSAGAASLPPDRADCAPAAHADSAAAAVFPPLRVHLVPAFDEPTMIVLRHALARNVVLTPRPPSPNDPPPPREPFDRSGAGTDGAPEDLDLATCHVLVSGRPTVEQLGRATQLRAVVIPWAGLPGATCEALRAFPQLTVHNLHDNAAPTAEMALALLLAAAKRIVPNDQALRQGDWRPRYAADDPSVLLEGKTAVILGYGAIGRRVARMCQGLGMSVIGVRRQHDPSPAEAASTAGAAASAPGGGNFDHHPEVPGVAIVATGGASTRRETTALHAVLRRAQVLIICLPLTPATEGLIGAAELALLPPGAVLVNTGRGPIVDQHALYQALRKPDHPLAAAGLDVWYNYPTDEASRAHTLPADVPFHELDNVVLSPHRAAIVHSAEARRRRMLALADLLNTAARGAPMPNRVDLDAGY